MRVQVGQHEAVSGGDLFAQERRRIRAEALEEAARTVEAFRPNDRGDGPLLLLDVTRAVAKRVRALK